MKKTILISKSFLLAACAAFLLPWCALAQNDTIEARIKDGVEARWGGSTSSVTKTPYLGLYEVFHEGEVFYTDENLTVFLLGPMIDAQTFKNVTAERLQRLMAINFSELPFKFAIKQVRGNGKYVVASFEDPNCGYCKRLAQDMAVLDNVTIYTFLYPILSQDSLEKSKQIWCSKDRVKAWNAWMRDGNEPASKGDCDTSAILRTRELGQRLKITGTPTLFFSDGLRFPGAMPIERIKLKLFGGQPAAQTPATSRGPAAQAGKAVAPPAVKGQAPQAGKATTPPAGKAAAPQAGKATAPKAGKAATPPAGKATAPKTGKATTPPAGKAAAPQAGKTTTPKAASSDKKP